MATLTQTYTWALYETELKEWLGITVTTFDAKLQGWLAAAVRAGDTYLNHFWIKNDGRTPTWIDEQLAPLLADGADIPHPEDVKDAVWEWVRIAQELYGDDGGGPRAFGLTSAKTGDLSEGYAVGSRIGGGEVSPLQITKLIQTYWTPYRRNRLI